MELVKDTKEYKIYKKRNGRYGVRTAERKWVNGEDKVKILLKEKLIKLSAPKKKEEPKPEAEETSKEAKAPEAEAKEAKAEAKPEAEGKVDAKPEAESKEKKSAE